MTTSHVNQVHTYSIVLENLILCEEKKSLNKYLIYVLYATFYIHLFSDIPLYLKSQIVTLYRYFPEKLKSFCIKANSKGKEILRKILSDFPMFELESKQSCIIGQDDRMILYYSLCTFCSCYLQQDDYAFNFSQNLSDSV